MDTYQQIHYAPSERDGTLRFFEDAFREMGFGFDLEAKDRDLTRIPEEYQTGAGMFLLLKHGGNTIGSVALRSLGDSTLELKRFYLLARYRGLGLGARLLNAALEHASQSQCEAIRLDTTTKSAKAIEMFQAAGFVCIPRYNDDPYAEIFMELKLPKANQKPAPFQAPVS